MPTSVFIHDEAILLPDLVPEGSTLSAEYALVLNYLWTRRHTSRLSYWCGKNSDATLDQVHAASISLAADISLDTNEDGVDPVYEEALMIAKDLIEAKLASENLPIPPTIEDHAAALINAHPQLLIQARKRIEIRRSVTLQTMRSLGDAQNIR